MLTKSDLVFVLITAAALAVAVLEDRADLRDQDERMRTVKAREQVAEQLGEMERRIIKEPSWEI